MSDTTMSDRAEHEYITEPSQPADAPNSPEQMFVDTIEVIDHSSPSPGPGPVHGAVDNNNTSTLIVAARSVGTLRGGFIGGRNGVRGGLRGGRYGQYPDVTSYQRGYMYGFGRHPNIAGSSTAKSSRQSLRNGSVDGESTIVSSVGQQSLANRLGFFERNGEAFDQPTHHYGSFGPGGRYDMQSGSQMHQLPSGQMGFGSEQPSMHELSMLPRMYGSYTQSDNQSLNLPREGSLPGNGDVNSQVGEREFYAMLGAWNNSILQYGHQQDQNQYGQNNYDDEEDVGGDNVTVNSNFMAIPGPDTPITSSVNHSEIGGEEPLAVGSKAIGGNGRKFHATVGSIEEDGETLVMDPKSAAGNGQKQSFAFVESVNEEDSPVVARARPLRPRGRDQRNAGKMGAKRARARPSSSRTSSADADLVGAAPAVSDAPIALLPSRNSGYKIHRRAHNRPPGEMLPVESLTPAALVKRGVSDQELTHVAKRAHGANDPENIRIVNMVENVGATWGEIADELNGDRIAAGLVPSFSANAVHNRYNRNAPLLFAAEGKVFVPIKERRAGYQSGTTHWTADLDVVLCEMVREVDAEKWSMVAARFNAATNKDIDAAAAAYRHTLI